MQIEHKLFSPLFFNNEDSIHKIKHFTKEQLIEGAGDDLIQVRLKECLEENDKNKFCELCYTLFSGDKQFSEFNKNFTLLKTFVISDHFLLEDIVHCFLPIFKSWKSEVKHTSRYDVQIKTPWKHGAAYGYEENESIYCGHGGGFNHLNDWLRGSEKTGYNCDGMGKGIFVTPIPKKTISDKIFKVDATAFFLFFDHHANEKVGRTGLYARRTPQEHFDSPAYACIKMKPENIHSSNNGYEAIILSKDIERIEKVRLECFEPLSSLSKNTINDHFGSLKPINYAAEIEKLDIHHDVKVRLIEGAKKLEYDYRQRNRQPWI